jgi:hypothetical protein
MADRSHTSDRRQASLGGAVIVVTALRPLAPMASFASLWRAHKAGRQR